MTNEQFEKYLPKYRTVISQLARKIARKHEELYEDLVQVGMITLWQLEPTNATSNEDAWIRQALYNKMTTVLRKTRPARFESLTSHLARGDQVTEDELTGDAYLIIASRRPKKERTGDQDDDEE